MCWRIAGIVEFDQVRVTTATVSVDSLQPVDMLNRRMKLVIGKLVALVLHTSTSASEADVVAVAVDLGVLSR